jgi:MOSC domain-containing protein YiiM
MQRKDAVICPSVSVAISELFRSQPTTLGPQEIVSSFIRTENPPELVVGHDDIFGNQVGNTEYHGGPFRVVHHFTGENYKALAASFPDKKHIFVPGSFGENFYSESLTGDDICLGDVFTTGQLKLQVTSPRFPCKKIDLRYEHNGILAWALRTGCVGWFYRVLNPGHIRKNQNLKLVERSTSITLRQMMEVAHAPKEHMELVPNILDSPALAPDWRIRIQKLQSKFRETDE